MRKRCKVRAKNIFIAFAMLALAILTFQLHASRNNISFIFFKDVIVDSPPIQIKPRGIKTSAMQQAQIKDTSNKIINNDSTLRTDTSKTKLVYTIDTLLISKDSFSAPIDYTATDSGVLIIPTREFILYGKAHVSYTDVILDAGTIKVDSTQKITAFGGLDTLKNPLDLPTLVQGGMTTKSDSIFYNPKSGKGLTKNSYLQQEEMFIYTRRAKQVEPGVFYALDSRFTTCNLDTPHFAIRAHHMKFINKKLAVSGFAQPEFEGVPVPIGLPFGIYPLNRARHSGFIMPTFAATEDFGLGLQGIGYYKVFNDNWDVTTRADLYSYGGWKLDINPRYLVRYKYQGNLNLSIQNTVLLNRGNTLKDEFTKTKSFQIDWSHSRDNRARPGTNFSASVHAGTTQFNRYQANNPIANFNNQLNSSINWSKTTDKTALSIGLNHSQNSNTRAVNVTLPNASFNLLTQYPFQRKERVGEEKWYEKLGIGYTGALQNQVFFYDTAVSFKRILDTAQWNVTHNIPITLSLPSLGPVTIAPGISYQEKWLGQKTIYSWDASKKQVVSKLERGFYTPRQTSFSLSASTRIFGTLQFKKGRVAAVRHEIRPSVGFSYVPSLVKKFYQTVQVDTSGRRAQFAQLQDGFSNVTSGSITFGVDNLLEMKVHDKKDTSAEALKKVKLLDGFGFSGSYNLLADSFKLSPISIYLRSVLFNKVNITSSATLDPYQRDDQGFSVNKYAWQNGKFKPGKITSGSIAISGGFQSKAKDERTDAERLPTDNYMTPDEQQRMVDYVRQNPAEFTDFNIPWTLQSSVSINFFNSYNPATYSYKTITTASMSLSGDFSLSPKWKIGGSAYYNFGESTIPSLSAFITRDMHCWQLAINLTPIGLYRSFSITLNPKSGILRDLRINRARTFYNLQ